MTGVCRQIKLKEKKYEIQNSLLFDVFFNSYEQFYLSGFWPESFYTGSAQWVKSLPG